MAGRSTQRRSSWLRDNGLLLVNLAIFALCFLGMVVSGAGAASAENVSHGEPPLTIAEYLATPDFLEATFENWESEFLQMGMYVVLTVFLFQRGSAESKDPDGDNPEDADPRTAPIASDAPWPVRRGGLALRLYEHSLSALFFLLFLASWWMHAVGGAGAYSEEQLAHGQPAVSVWEYLGTSQFWFESMQNWQSEFLAVAAIVGASVWLRERGSAESKPVAAPHRETA